MQLTKRALRLSVTALLMAVCTWAQGPSQGVLHTANSKGEAMADCPLKHTSVKADIAGMVARVTVEQQFQNPYREVIEANYVFPLPQNAAVDSMVMTVGDRVIQGKIKAREDAQALYDAARQAGKVASLLHQERPNIFSQAVANILPGESIRITIAYLQILPYQDGDYEFRFPMVVGPRYIPGTPVGRQGGGRLPDTDRVPDASRITPPVMPEGMRAGHDISIDVSIDAGIPIGNPVSKTHDVNVIWHGPTSASVKLRDENTIPNKDFVLRYDLAGRTIQDTLLTHRSVKGGYFTLILQPPEKFNFTDTAPKEIIFVLDTSGSMSGFPIEKAKEAMKLAIDGLYPRDTFNLITFSGETSILFPQPVAATSENRAMARMFLQSRQGMGGTEMMKAIRAALDPSDEPGRLRTVCFMTDGYVGNDMEILGEIQKHPNARVFAFGIGNSVNHFLLDGMAQYGRGEVQYVGLQDDGTAAARKFHERIRNPLLTDIRIDWGALGVTDVYPKRIPDLYGVKPVVVTGRFNAANTGTAVLHGKMGGVETTRRITVTFPDMQPAHDVIATLWARNRVGDLLAQDLMGAQTGNIKPELKKEITQLGIDYQIATQFTSFIAVEERAVNAGGLSRRIEVPVNIPEGVNYETTVSAGSVRGGAASLAVSNGTGYGMGSGSGGGIGSGMGAGSGGGGGGVGGAVGGVLGGIVSVPSAVPAPLAAPRMAPPAVPVMSKIDPNLSARMQNGAKDVVKVQILLADATPATLEALKQAGFVLIKAPGKDLQALGTITIDQLTKLSNLNSVRFIVEVRGQ